jgi:serine/threonine protein kinase
LAADQLLERQVAIKCLRERYVHHPKVRERFRREGIAAARVEHANLVPVHDVLLVNDLPYIVTGFMPGGSLLAVVRRDGSRNPEEFIRLTEDLLRGLQCMHGQGFVHRDIKPSNVLFDAEGGARLADFGVAHLAEEMRITGTREVVGTPVFMAPECLAGTRADPLSDLFSLGKTLVYAANASMKRSSLPDDFPLALHKWIPPMTASGRSGRYGSVRQAHARLQALLDEERTDTSNAQRNSSDPDNSLLDETMMVES